MPVIMRCKLCNAEFKVKPSHVSKRTYCSMKCRNKSYVKERVLKECIGCKKQFEVYDNKWRKDAKYCSHKCQGIHLSDEKHWNYKGPGNRLEDDPEHLKARRRHNYVTKDTIKNNVRKGKMKRERNLVVGHTFQEWIELLKSVDNLCHYCGERMTKTAGRLQRTRDHIISVSSGGSDKIENIVPACRSCNSKKGKMTYDEFLEKIGKVKNDVPPSSNM